MFRSIAEETDLSRRVEILYMSREIPVKLKHRTGDGHSSRHLEGHSAEDILQVTGVGMKGRLVQLLCIDDLLSGRIGRLLAKPTKYSDPQIIRETRKRQMYRSLCYNCRVSYIQMIFFYKREIFIYWTAVTRSNCKSL